MIPLRIGWRRAKSTDPSTWRSYDEALKALETGHYAGVGRVIEAGGDYVGVDLDGCRNPSTGEITPWAWKILERLDSYSEVSPSLKGVKVWVKASLDRSYAKPGLEVYCRARYFVTTGQILPQYSATIEERSSALAKIIAEEFPRMHKHSRSVSGVYDGPRIGLLDFIDSGIVKVFGEVPDGSGKKFAISCPWIDQHSEGDSSGTYVGQYESGALWFKCHHAHCWQRDWRDFRRETSPRLLTIRIAPRGCPVGLEVTIDRG